MRQEPENIELWLEYIDFQDIALADSDFELQIANQMITTNTEKKKKSKDSKVFLRSKAIVEKKLSIIKSALDHNPKSVKLSIKRLELSKEIMDSTTLNRQWKELLFLFPGTSCTFFHLLILLSQKAHIRLDSSCCSGIT